MESAALEREAERVADAAPSIVAGRPPLGRAAPAALRPPAGDLPLPVRDVLQMPGRPLDRITRTHFEPRLGISLDAVRVHVGPAAERATAALQAQAFAIGRDVVFAAGTYAPATPAGRRLLAHELAHVAQQGRTGPMLQRQPRPGGRTQPPGPPPALAKRPEPGDTIDEVRRDRDLWSLLMKGVTTVEIANVLLWKKYEPPFGVKVTVPIAVEEPAQLALVEIHGLTSAAIKHLEPSVAARFARMGLTETSDAEFAALTPAFQDARAKFWKHSDLDAKALLNIDKALKQVAGDNPELMTAFYEYYAQHDLGDDPDDGAAGTTNRGDSEIDARVLALRSRITTDDPVTLLGGVLLHEYSHTPQGSATHAVAAAPLEAKAYAIEVFFADRLKDEARADVIYRRYRNDAVDAGTGSKRIFLRTYWYMKELYKVIDTGGLQQAKEARQMSVEFISKNEADYSARLKAFMAAHPF